MLHNAMAAKNRKTNGFTGNARVSGSAAPSRTPRIGSTASGATTQASSKALRVECIKAGSLPPTTPARAPSAMPAERIRLKANGRLRSVVSRATAGERQTIQMERHAPEKKPVASSSGFERKSTRNVEAAPIATKQKIRLDRIPTRDAR